MALREWLAYRKEFLFCLHCLSYVSLDVESLVLAVLIVTAGVDIIIVTMSVLCIGAVHGIDHIGPCNMVTTGYFTRYITTCIRVRHNHA